ncbi:MAG: ParB/RepB/Spo0J family partition protein [Rhodospirillales bacterium]|nr:ParB/RepB/Spo0J family partition protein [Rhodospirillales bacterium]
MSQGPTPPRGPGARPAGLGRGLMALLGEDEAKQSGQTERVVASRTLPIEQLKPGRFQPRQRFDDEPFQSLVESVRAKGILQPILVRRDPDTPHLYEIVAGERRWRAAQAAQLHEVPVVIREMADRDALEVALVENIQRQDLTAIEEADGYRRLMDEFGHTQEALSKALGKSRPHIANQLRLLTLPKTVKDFINEGALSAGHARTLVGAPDPESLAIKIVAEGLSVREAEELAKSGRPAKKGGSAPRKGAAAKDADTLAIERELGALLGLNVDISFKNGGGKLTIHYKTLDQLDEVLRRISQGAGKPTLS